MDEKINVLAAMGFAAQALELDGNPNLAGDMREACAAVAELIEAATAEANFTPEAQRENWSCHYGITTTAKCGRCSRELRLAKALAHIG